MTSSIEVPCDSMCATAATGIRVPLCTGVPSMVFRIRFNDSGSLLQPTQTGVHFFARRLDLIHDDASFRKEHSVNPWISHDCLRYGAPGCERERSESFDRTRTSSLAIDVSIEEGVTGFPG